MEKEQSWEELVWLLVPSATTQTPLLFEKGLTSKELRADGRER